MADQRSLTISSEDPFAMIFLSTKKNTNPLTSSINQSLDYDYDHQENMNLNQNLKPSQENSGSTRYLLKKDKNSSQQVDNHSEEHLQFFPDFDGAKDSKNYNIKSFKYSKHNEFEKENGGMKQTDHNNHWKNEAYWRLPENVRNAVDLANVKSKHTQFWRRLEAMNDKIFVIREVFYGRVPGYQKEFYEKKKKELEM